MNARAMEPLAIEFIFGDPALHARFSIAIDLMARLVMVGPKPLTCAALANAAGHPPRTVRTLLSSLHGAGLILQQPDVRDAWTCAPNVERLTLADVFRSIADRAAPLPRPDESSHAGAAGPAPQGIDLLLMQATMAINQVVLQHLQTFDLGRLRAVGAPAAFHTFTARAGHRSRFTAPA